MNLYPASKRWDFWRQRRQRSSQSLGQRPRVSWGPKAAALKARFTSRAGSITDPIEARFQRFFYTAI
jgi:hypothetical protein